MGLVEEGSEGAGLRGRDDEYAFLPTSEWTEMIADLYTGNFMLHTELFSLPGTPLSLPFTMTYSSLNANMDIGLGKGWTSNLHSCVSEEAQTHDLLYVDGTGAKHLFTWDSNNSVYVNPPGFAGEAEELVGGGYTITPLGSGTITFTSAGKLSEIADICGTGKLWLSYDGSGRPETVTDYLSGREITLTWGENGKVTAVTDSMSHAWSLTYDENDLDLTEIVKPNSPTVKTTFSYNGAHQMITHQDFSSNTYQMTYFSSGAYANRLSTWVQPTTPSSATTTFVYDTATGYSLKTTVTDPSYHAVDFYFGSTSFALEKVSKTADSVTITTEKSYDANGFLTTQTDALENETTFAYDDVYHLTTITYPMPSENGTSFVKQWVYDYETVSGKLTQYKEKLTSSVWAETDYEYEDNDAPRKPSSITNPLNQETTIEYNSNGLPSTVTSPTSASGYSTKTTTYTYDATTKVISRIRDGSGNDTAITYNSNGLPSVVSQYEGTYDSGTLLTNSTHTYNDLGQVTATSDSVTSETTSVSYTNNGAVSSSTNATGCENEATYTLRLAVILPGDPRYDITKPACSALSAPFYTEINLFHPAIVYRPLYETKTDTQNHTTTYSYNANGTMSGYADYVSLSTAFARDGFDRIITITDPFGRETAYTYNLNSKVTQSQEDGQAAITYTYDDASRLTQKVDPVRGTIPYTYTVNNHLASDEFGSYSYNYLGQKTQLSYTGGGTDSWSYNDDQLMSEWNEFDFTNDRSGNMIVWSDGANDATFAYTGAEGSIHLGLPSSLTGTGDIGDYSYAYTARYWLDSLQDTSKITQTYDYVWGNSHELTDTDFPNEVALQQQWTNKMLDRVIVDLDSEAYDYISTDSTFNGNDEFTGYTQTVQRDSQNAFTETNGLTYNGNHQISTISYSSNSRTITYGYDAGIGQINSTAYSDITGLFSVNYNGTTNNLSSLTYPSGLGSGSETYTYEPTGRGRLTQITYPNTDTLVFSWNNKDQITQITFDDGTTETSYAITYNGMGKVASYTKSEDSYEIEEWTFVYGPHGLEYARKFVNDEEVITQDFTSDLQGRILSMTYTEDNAQEGVNGEYYFHYDNFGNTVLLTDEDGFPQYTALYDISNGKRVQEWNPYSLDFAIKGEGLEEKISFEISDIQLTLHYELTVRKYSAIAIIGNKDWIDLTVRGGATIKTCVVRCPAGQVMWCYCCYHGQSKKAELGYAILDRCLYFYDKCPEEIDVNARNVDTGEIVEVIKIKKVKSLSWCACYDKGWLPIE